jgi:two-component system, response regulator YesN
MVVRARPSGATRKRRDSARSSAGSRKGARPYRLSVVGEFGLGPDVGPATRDGLPVRSILIVEDDHVVSDLVTLLLGSAFTVRQTTTANEALQILERERIDLVVLDHRLPDGSGLDVLTSIRATHLKLPVIMTTGYGSEELCRAAFKLGVADYLVKPFDVFEFKNSVRCAFARESSDALPSPGPFHGSKDLVVQKAVLLINHRYWDRLSLRRLASDVGISPYRLSHRFHEVMGVSFRAYLLRVRLERAKHLLAHRRASITEVAQAVGFGDLPRFDKLFKRDTGVTPSTYRSRRRRDHSESIDVGSPSEA